MKTELHHRSDIDGLRALAIIPVVLYHVKAGFPGGFVGVDVFFVISGYLICSLILKDQERGVFSLANFWERRVRRIFPALATVVFATLCGCWLLFSAEDFSRFASSLIPQALLVSNIFFYRESFTLGGYFAPVTESRPLLHTWSLAVEEQFYLFFPLLLIALARFRRFPVIPTMLALAAGSLTFSIWETLSPETRSAAFYLLPSRAWELLVGVLLAVSRGKISAGRGFREVAGWLGATFIGAAMACYDDHTAFPGATALPPCLGAALIIFSSENQISQVGRILSWRPLVFIGLISYSLYLWHWPVLVFVQTLSTNQHSPRIAICVIVISTVLAALSLKFVETPFRKRQWFANRRPLFVFAGALTVIFLCIGEYIEYQKGAVWRIDGHFIHYTDARNRGLHCPPVSLEDALAGHFIPIGTKETNQPLDLLVWGDSHSLSLTLALDGLCRQYSRNAAVAFFPNIPPVLAGGGYQRKFYHSKDGMAYDPEKVVLDFITKNHPKMVIMTGFWPEYEATDAFKQQLLITVEGVIKSGTKLWVVKDTPDPLFDTPRVVALTSLFHGDIDSLGLTPAQQAAASHGLADTFDRMPALGARVLDPTPYFLNEKGIYGVVKNDQVLYSDYNHLTKEGAALLVPLFRPIFLAN